MPHDDLVLSQAGLASCREGTGKKKLQVAFKWKLAKTISKKLQPVTVKLFLEAVFAEDNTEEIWKRNNRGNSFKLEQAGNLFLEQFKYQP